MFVCLLFPYALHDCSMPISAITYMYVAYFEHVTRSNDTIPQEARACTSGGNTTQYPATLLIGYLSKAQFCTGSGAE